MPDGQRLGDRPSPAPHERLAKPSGYRPQLDGIRAVAVIMVVLFHLGYSWIPGGFVGVDVFFVMSGYLITGLLLVESDAHPHVRFGRFYARRMRRLLPAAALVLLVVIVASANLLNLLGQQSVGHDVTAAALYLANWHFAAGSTGYFTPGDVPSPVVHFWSLAVEEQFYFVWPAMFAVLWKASKRRTGKSSLSILLGGIIVLGLISAVLSVVMVPSNLAYYGTQTRAYQLLTGAALAVLAHRFADRVPASSTARLVGACTVAGSLAVLFYLGHTIESATMYPGVEGLVVTASSVALIAALDLAPRGISQRLFSLKPVAGIGRLSYSLYLWHWPIIVFAPVIAKRYGHGWMSSRPTMVAAMSAAALLSYYLLEQPVRVKLLPRTPYRFVIGMGLALSVTVALIGIPFLQPKDTFQVKTLAAVRDSAKPGDCPYFTPDWRPIASSEPCVYRKGGPFVIALVGDSHAQQWQPAIDKIAKRYNLTVIRVTQRGCPANDITVLSLDDQGLSHTYQECTRWRHRVYQRLIDKYDPNVIYVENRSHDWTIKTAKGDVTKDDPRHLKLWTDAWIPTLKTLTSGTGTVIVGRTTPNIAWNVPACLAANGKGTKKCDMPLSGDKGVVPYNKAMDALPSKISGVVIVDPTKFICPDDVCPAVIDGVIVHRDDDHVSATFARKSADKFEKMLVAAGVKFPDR